MRRRSRVGVTALAAIVVVTAGVMAISGEAVAADGAAGGGSYQAEAGVLARVEVFDGVLDLWPLNLVGTSRDREIRIESDLGVSTALGGGLQPDRAAFRVTGLGGAATLTAGFDKPRWGAGRYRTLILSDSVRPYEQVRADIHLDTRLGGVEYSRLAGKLEPLDDTYLLGHRLEYWPWPWLRLGATETAIVSGRFARQAVNWLPLWPFYLTQHIQLKRGLNINNDDNENVGLDATVSLNRDSSLYGEFFVDDMPQNPANHGLYQIGFLAGAVIKAPVVGGIQLGAEYARVNNYTYTFQDSSKSYVHYGQPLGFLLGPDTDSLIVMATKKQPFELGAGFEFRRHGPGRLGDNWESPDIGWEKGRQRQFLYHDENTPIEKTLLGRIQAAYTLADAAGSPRVEGSLAVGRSQDAGNKPGAVAPVVEFTVAVRWGFSGPGSGR